MSEAKAPIGIIGAMSIEIEALLEIAEISKTETFACMQYHSGTLSGVPVVIACCRAGKINSALCAQVMIDHYEPRAVINCGVAGGIGPDVHIGDVVIATGCVQYDFDTTSLEGGLFGELNVPGQEEKIRAFPCENAVSAALAETAETLYNNCHRGIIATGDLFVSDPEKANFLHKELGALACEMEGASIAHACYLNRTPCAVLRTISDNGNDEATVDFPTFAKESAKKAQQLLTAALPQM